MVGLPFSPAHIRVFPEKQADITTKHKKITNAPRNNVKYDSAKSQHS
jgi:hypothetical protein